MGNVESLVIVLLHALSHPNSGAIEAYPTLCALKRGMIVTIDIVHAVKDNTYSLYLVRQRG